MNRFLTFNFFLLFLFASCGTYRYPNASGLRESVTQELNSYYTDTAHILVYRTKLQAFDNDIQGSMTIKTLARNEHRVTLVSDFDQTLFDVHISPNGHKLHYATPSLGKRTLVKEMVNMLRTMTAQRFATSAVMFANQQHYYPVYVVDDCYYVVKGRKVARIQQAKGSKEHVEIIYQAWNTQDMPTSITMAHKKFPITIDLTLDAKQSSL